MVETDIDMDLDKDLNHDTAPDPHTEAHNMDMTAPVDHSIETRCTTIDVDCTHKHIDRHSNFSNPCACIHLQAS